MPATMSKKNKVILSDYNYKRDVDIRLLIARLSVYEIDALREILDNSLQISIPALVESLGSTEDKLMPFIEQLVAAKLLKIQGSTLHVDKEMRKFYETQIIKLDESFEPGMEFLQSQLSKVPMPVLPNWYAIPRTSDHIFNAIIEKFLATPKLYERYLYDVHFDNDVLNKIVKDVMTSPDLSVRGQDLIKNYRLTPEQFEEYILFLEFNFVCCLSYRKSKNKWEEVVTPFYEWAEYLRYQRNMAPKPIDNPEKICKQHPEPFGFINDLMRILKAAQKKPLALQDQMLCPKETGSLLAVPPTSSYLQNLLDKIIFMRLGEIRNQQLHLLDSASAWINKTVQDKALCMSRHPIQVEKGLRAVSHSGWVYLDDFVKGFTGILSGKEPITLKQKGKRWKYTLPTYNEEELSLIETTVHERLFEAGIVDIGTHAGRVCLCVTPFGRMLIEE